MLLLRATRASAALAAAVRRKPAHLAAVASSSSSFSSGRGKRKGQKRDEAKPPPQPRRNEFSDKKKPNARPSSDKKGRAVEAQVSQRPEIEMRRKPPPPQQQQQERPKRPVRWKCASGCGACCKLDKGPDFPTPDEVLADHPDLLQVYKSMIGSDGWCTNYDKSTRTCNIYQDRPLFCRVEPKVFDEFFGVPRSAFDREACSACVDNIKMAYGQESDELSNFKRVIREESKKLEASKNQDKLLDT